MWKMLEESNNQQGTYTSGLSEDVLAIAKCTSFYIQQELMIRKQIHL